ncbi:hypothetical protein [Polaromonas sp. DSR2-3-2]|uniref:hypothetical protein n=1 Tax=unclassified Polaromonas TaxID=2638319 RepID=UPI003CFACCE1
MCQPSQKARLPAFTAVLCMPFLLAIPISVPAQEFPQDEAVFHGLSYHSKDRPNGKDWNQTNWGLAWRHVPSEKLSWQLGAYRDSMFHTTAYGLLDYTPFQGLGLQAGGFAGARSSKHKTEFVGGAVIRYQANRYSVTARLGPAQKSGGFVFAIEAGYRF